MQPLFWIDDIRHERNHLEANISIDRNHDIFNGHFPNRPIMPGVCMIEMVLHVMQKVTRRPIRLQRISNLKFLSIWIPDKFETVAIELDYTMEGDNVNINNCRIWNNDNVFLKFKGKLNVGN